MRAERQLAGYCYPVRKKWLIGGVGFMRQLDVSETELNMMLGGNAIKLLKIAWRRPDTNGE